MRFLVDNSISWRIARDLRDAGHDAVHVGTLGLADRPDPVLFQHAKAENRDIITQDADFGPLLAASGAPRPSIILFRTRTGRPGFQSRLLLSNLPQIEDDLAQGAYIVIEETAIHITRTG